MIGYREFISSSFDPGVPPQMTTNAQRRRAERDAQHATKTQQRSDAYLENNNCWDELQGVYNNCKALLFQYVTLLQHAGDPSLRPFFTAALAQAAARLIRIVSADLSQLSGELNKIAAQHEGKTGGAKTMEEMAASLQFWEQYQLFIERHSGVVSPSVNELLEVINQVEAMRDAKVREVSAQDPNDNTPIDVEAKTVELLTPHVSGEQPSGEQPAAVVQ